MRFSNEWKKKHERVSYETHELNQLLHMSERPSFLNSSNVNV